MVQFIPGDVEYFIDSAIECCDIGVDVSNWFRYCINDPGGTFDKLERSVIRDDTLSHGQNLFNTCKHFEQGYINWLSENDLKQSMVARFGGAIAISEQFIEIFKTVVNPLVKPEQYNLPMFNNLPKTIDQSFKDYSIAPKLEMLQRIKRRWSLVSDQYSIQEYHSDLRRIIDQRNHTVKEAIEQFRLNYVDYPDDEYIERDIEVLKKFPSKKEISAKRKTIKKSIRLAHDVLPSTMVNMFVKNEKIILEGEKYNFHLTKDSYSLINAHGGVQTKVYDKGNNYLYNVCVYSDDMPVLDHVVSLYLHIKSGLEQEIIDSGNKYVVGGSGERLSIDRAPLIASKGLLSQRDVNYQYRKVFKAFDQVIDVKDLLHGLPKWEPMQRQIAQEIL